MNIRARLKKLEDEYLRSGDYYIRFKMMEEMNELNTNLSEPMDKETEKKYNDIFFKFVNMGINSSKSRTR